MLFLPGRFLGRHERRGLSANYLRFHPCRGAGSGKAQPEHDLHLCLRHRHRQLGERPLHVGAREGQDRKRPLAPSVPCLYVPTRCDYSAPWHPVEDRVLPRLLRAARTVASVPERTLPQICDQYRTDRPCHAQGGEARLAEASAGDIGHQPDVTCESSPSYSLSPSSSSYSLCTP